MSHSLPTISIRNDQFHADILLQGAQLMHFQPRGQKPWIFQNAHTPFEPGREIYAGVPLVFPWFNLLREHPHAPNHGWARQAQWKLEHQSDDGAQVSLMLSSEDVREQGLESLAWSGEFLARMSFLFGESLGLLFEVENRDTRTISFECAFHPYFVVSDVRKTTVEGVPDGVWLGSEHKRALGGTLAFPPFGARLFVDSSGPVFIREPERTFRLTALSGWNSTVVWNPGSAMEDLIESDWPNFVCVESGALRSNVISLEPGESYALDVTVELN
ncbi:putative glucose-6-phosphate 1-epimerase [Abditibacteriota bacterium]|nr:putative glucose-6-phosphate 1-epimerase [Abditibacteriota bacterium]